MQLCHSRVIKEATQDSASTIGCIAKATKIAQGSTKNDGPPEAMSAPSLPRAPRSGARQSPPIRSRHTRRATRILLDIQACCPQEKLAIAFAAGILSLFSTVTGYFTESFYFSLFLLIFSALLTGLNLALAIWICTQERSVVTTGGLIPILLAVVPGILIMSLAAAHQANQNALANVNARVLGPSLGVLGGLGLGATIGYLFFAT